ncbi:MAG: hypothetical protein ABI702_07705 [Burkholderiales bacterium]
MGNSAGDNAADNGFSRLDTDFIRVLEDVIDALIMKNLLAITDLPESAQAKLVARKSFRDQMGAKVLRLFSSTGFSEVIDDTGFGTL